MNQNCLSLAFDIFCFSFRNFFSLQSICTLRDWALNFYFNFLEWQTQIPPSKNNNSIPCPFSCPLSLYQRYISLLTLDGDLNELNQRSPTKNLISAVVCQTDHVACMKHVAFSVVFLKHNTRKKNHRLILKDFRRMNFSQITHVFAKPPYDARTYLLKPRSAVIPKDDGQCLERVKISQICSN